MEVLVTGGAGYIGSTIASACLDAGLTPVVLDDLSTGRREFAGGRALHVGDIGDPALLDRVFAAHPGITAAVHCAARVVVPESVTDPVAYYETNVAGTLRLAAGLVGRGCTRLVLSSSASVYAPGEDLAVDESSPLAPTSPYARTKAMAEQILADVAAASPLRVLALRYFNPIGADPRLRTGLHSPDATHVMGRLLAAHRGGATFTVTGTDWPTRDGSGIRDYVHVWDLARAHVAALQRFDAVTAPRPFEVINLGTGAGTTVRELVAAFRSVVGDVLRVVDGPRRPGDVVGSYALTDRATELLGWKAELSLEDGVRDALAWAARRDTVLGPVAPWGAGYPPV